MLEYLSSAYKYIQFIKKHVCIMACLGDWLPESLGSDSQSKQLNPAGGQSQVGLPNAQYWGQPCLVSLSMI